MKKGILCFDFDGVIADSFEDTMAFYNSNCEQYGLKPMKDREEFGRLWDRNFFKMIISLGISPFKLKKYIKRFREVFSTEYDHIKIFSGVREVISKLSKNYKIFIISSNFNSILVRYLKRHKIKVDGVIGADKETSKVKKILSLKKEFPNLEVYYIGDTVGDVFEGKEAKVKTISATWGFHSRKKLEKAKPDYLANSPKDLLKILN